MLFYENRGKGFLNRCMLAENDTHQKLDSVIKLRNNISLTLSVLWENPVL